MPLQSFTWNGITLSCLNSSVERVPGTLKQVVGTNLVTTPIPGRTVMDYRLTIQGLFRGTNRESNRSSLNDDYSGRTPRNFVNGLQDGVYVIEDLKFTDAGERPEIYDFVLTIIQWQQ